MVTKKVTIPLKLAGGSQGKKMQHSQEKRILQARVQNQTRRWAKCTLVTSEGSWVGFWNRKGTVAEKPGTSRKSLDLS